MRERVCVQESLYRYMLYDHYHCFSSRFHHPHLLEAGGLGGGGGVDAEEGGGGHAHPEVGGGPPGLGGGGQGQAVAHPTTDLALKHR